MESKRQQKFARQLQKDLSELFQRDFQGQFGRAMVTVTDVKMSPDLAIARVYLSFLMTENKQLTLELVQEKTKSLRQVLGSKIRHYVRVIPELHFFLDDTAEYAAKMDELFANLQIPPATEEPAAE